MFLLWSQCMCFFICYNLQIIQLHKTHLSLSPCDYSACVKALNSKSSSYKTNIWVFLCVIAVHVFLKFLLIPSYKATQNTITFTLWSQCMWFFSCYNLQIIQLHKTHWSSLCLLRMVLAKLYHHNDHIHFSCLNIFFFLERFIKLKTLKSQWSHPFFMLGKFVLIKNGVSKTL